MKYILTLIVAAFALSACCTEKCDIKHGSKSAVSDSCCKADGSCSKKH
jgi:hypothetical protein